MSQPDQLVAPGVGWRWWLAGLGALTAAVLLGAAVGPANIGLGDAARVLLDFVPGGNVETGLSERELGILQVVRFPRVILAVIVGSALAISGAAYQGVFRNPLADPYLLGVAAGAGGGCRHHHAPGSSPRDEPHRAQAADRLSRGAPDVVGDHR